MIASNLALFAWKPVDETKIKNFKENRENLLDKGKLFVSGTNFAIPCVISKICPFDFSEAFS